MARLGRSTHLVWRWVGRSGGQFHPTLFSNESYHRTQSVAGFGRRFLIGEEFGDRNSRLLHPFRWVVVKDADAGSIGHLGDAASVGASRPPPLIDSCPTS